jgi:hypothetical protein
VSLVELIDGARVLIAVHCLSGVARLPCAVTIGPAWQLSPTATLTLGLGSTYRMCRVTLPLSANMATTAWHQAPFHTAEHFQCGGVLVVAVVVALVQTDGMWVSFCVLPGGNSHMHVWGHGLSAGHCFSGRVGQTTQQWCWT